PRLAYEDMKTPYRNLASDIAEKRTAYSLINQSGSVIEGLKTKITFELLLNWTVTPTNLGNHQESMTLPLSKSADFEEVFDLQATPKKDRSEKVLHLAESYTAIFQGDDVRFWLAYLWACLTLADQGNQEPLYLLYTSMRRTHAAMLEGGLKNPTGLFMSMLKKSAHFEQIRRETKPETRSKYRRAYHGRAGNA
ncbi:MAG: hypothetical protein KC422_23030, partial [Trueperaceae bacterium]|nr:hypothetical protein [Trueperaceae bacterium]